MNKKEIAEIRKQFSFDYCPITRVCGCYVDAEKNIQLTSREAFLSLPEESIFKYLAIFRKTLSGKIAKNLINIDFPIMQESSGGTQEFLLRLRNSKLTDDDLLTEFYEKVIENYVCTESYYITLIHVAYDIPGKSSDNTEVFDASDEVYEFIMCDICPAKLSKPGLSYKSEKSAVESRERDWVIADPAHGFLFPEFNDRSADIHSVLYYSKKPDEPQFGFLKELFGYENMVTALKQKDIFNSVISEVFGKDMTFDDVMNIQAALADEAEAHAYDVEPVLYGEQEIGNILLLAGYDKDITESLAESWDSENVGATELSLENISCGKQLKIETLGASIKIDSKLLSDGVSVKQINGSQCIVIPTLGRICVDGIEVKK